MNGTVLVTGAGGYIGRHVVLALLERGVHVKALDLRLDGVDERAERLTLDLFSGRAGGGRRPRAPPAGGGVTTWRPM